ncbi:NUDIX hydrolase [Rhodospira trueperi]|uniref:8-oxo-dGTP diphosphatase n=1 Tax=Rhodospira trueperi TaxID=69960 RepID=A0A1G7DJK9_9PROT|nr:NUDIX domain-containing protein [Rhodospira trueperi]SDE51728.1 8-oxo-dGTP diphosphatase [Rhodospira trueperi]
MPYTYTHPHPAVTTDIVVFTVETQALKVLLIRRKGPPHEGQWALPGGFVRIDESVDACAVRELEEETGLKGIYLEQLYTFGDPDRDTRERVISVAYYALVPLQGLELRSGTDAADAAWWTVGGLPVLAFDHGRIVTMARARLTAKMEYSTVGLLFMPDSFTLSDLQGLYETVSGRPRDKRNFRKWILSLDVVEETGERKAEGAHRPAMLYRMKTPGNVKIIK